MIQNLFNLSKSLNICLVVLITCSGCVTHINSNNSSQLHITSGPVVPLRYTVYKDQVFTPDDWPESLAGDLYLPDGSRPHATVMLVHGGGWERRGREDMNSIAEYLVEHGFAVFNISYRFAPEYTFPAQIHDLQQAVRWLRRNSDRYRIDPERIGAYGFSSGGHLVLMLGTISPGDELDRPYGGENARIQAVVAGSAPTDLRKFKGGRLVPQFLGKRYEEDIALFAQASPIANVTADDPPVFLYHGELDMLVDVTHSRDMKLALDDANVKAELYIVHYLGHASLFVLNDSATEAAQVFLRRYLSKEGDSISVK